MAAAHTSHWHSTVDVWDISGEIAEHVATAPAVTAPTLGELVDKVSDMLVEAYPSASEEAHKPALAARVASLRVSISRTNGNTMFRVRFTEPGPMAAGIKRPDVVLMATCSIRREPEPGASPGACETCGRAHVAMKSGPHEDTQDE